MNIFRATQVFKICFIFYFSLNIMIVVALEKGRNDRYQIIKSEQLLTKPVYTFVKTDKNANIKWGVRHYVPRTIRRTDFND
ncbi:unnamed protein product [Lasius platythorax]|uniref:Uncharacterized protein n=1 Tax=Lasius platythorax TaxID=488582 RepID=A0AAV2N0B8_9HYME